MSPPERAASVTRTLRLKIKPEACAWLNAAAIEVNQVWNWANATTIDAADRNRRAHARLLSGFDLCKLAAGASAHFAHIGSDTIQRACCEYACQRRAVRRARLRWRVSRGSRRSLGWIPFKADSIRRSNRQVRFCGKTLRVFESSRLDGVKWKQGCFAQDAAGDWWLCLPMEILVEQTASPRDAVGIDLGLYDAAVTSDGDRLAASIGRDIERDISHAQRRGHRKQAKRIYRRAKRRRADAMHKFSRRIVDQYQHIVIGDVSSAKLVKTRMAKSVYDAGWSMLKTQLQYKGEHAGRTVEVVNEAFTTRACSQCGALSGPQGLRQLVVREWTCAECGAAHDRDINAARNILALRCRASVSGNESLQPLRAAA